VERPVVQAEPTSSAAQVAQRVVTAAVQEWHPSVPGDQLDMVCRTDDQVNGQPACKWGEAPSAMTVYEAHRSCTTCQTAETHPTSNLHDYILHIRQLCPTQIPLKVIMFLEW